MNVYKRPSSIICFNGKPVNCLQIEEPERGYVIQQLTAMIKRESDLYRLARALNKRNGSGPT